MFGFLARRRWTRQNSAECAWEGGEREKRAWTSHGIMKRLGSQRKKTAHSFSLTKHSQFFVQEGTDESEEKGTFPLDVVFLNQIGQQSQSLPAK